MIVTERNLRTADKLVEVLEKEGFSVWDAEEILEDVSKRINQYSPVQRVDYQGIFRDIKKISEQEIKERATRIVMIDVESADCITRHMQAFIDQSGERVADFAKPCVGCKYAELCKYDWLGKMQSLFNQSDEEFSACHSKE